MFNIIFKISLSQMVWNMGFKYGEGRSKQIQILLGDRESRDRDADVRRGMDVR